MWRNGYATLKYGDSLDVPLLTILFTATDVGGPLVSVKEETPLRVGNMMAAWSVADMVLKRFCDGSYMGKLLGDISFPKDEKHG